MRANAATCAPWQGRVFVEGLIVRSRFVQERMTVRKVVVPQNGFKTLNDDNRVEHLIDLGRVRSQVVRDQIETNAGIS